MAKRILVPIAPGAPADYARAAVRAARIARKTGGIVRLAYLRPLPPPRVDRQDRVVADADREMERLSAHAETHLAALAADMDGVPVETVIRFGDPEAELSIEAEVFHADLIALAAPLHARMRDRFRAWRLQRAAVASRVPVMLLPMPADGAGARGRSAVAVPALR